MTVKINDHGKNNKIEISQDSDISQSGTININGDDNYIRILPTKYHIGLNANIQSNCILDIGDDINCQNLNVYLAENSRVRIGSHVGLNGLVRLLLHEAAEINIGDYCLIADQVDISVSDIHSIIDLTDLKRINYAKSIVIADRVWIGQRSLILRGAEIGEGSIIKPGSIVTSVIPSNCIAAGNPATVMQEQVSWNFQLI